MSLKGEERIILDWEAEGPLKVGRKIAINPRNF
jgi:hypothetical protein